MLNILKKMFGPPDDGPLREVIQSGAFLVDVRTSPEFSAGSAPGSVNIPLDTIAGRLEQFKGKKNIVVFCRSGNRSVQAKNVLERNGFNNVVDGGTWQNVKRLAMEDKIAKNN